MRVVARLVRAVKAFKRRGRSAEKFTQEWERRVERTVFSIHEDRQELLHRGYLNQQTRNALMERAGQLYAENQFLDRIQENGLEMEKKLLDLLPNDNTDEAA